jgi:hypothetical protein
MTPGSFEKDACSRMHSRGQCALSIVNEMIALFQ